MGEANHQILDISILRLPSHENMSANLISHPSTSRHSDGGYGDLAGQAQFMKHSVQRAWK
jgi:hypothetical protein